MKTPKQQNGANLMLREIARRDFLKGMFATMALPALGSPLASLSGGAPNLVLGIVSDIHVSLWRKGGQDVFDGGNVFRRTLEWFRVQGVDAVAVCGDLANFALVEELEAVGRIWNEVFGATNVERLFVYGNHDWEGMNYGSHAKDLFGESFFDHTIRKDLGAAWRKAFGEDFTPVWRKEIKGYSFVGAHWIADHCRGKDELGVPQATEWFAKNGRTLDPSKPFFYIQHPPLKDTCVGPWHWGRDTGEMTRLFASSYPNAIALTGHSHVSLTDERSVWRGKFTSINAGSLKYTGVEYGDLSPLGRENDSFAATPDEAANRVMDRISTWDGHQGMIARIYDDRITLERRDFEDMGSLGGDWILPLDGSPIIHPKSVAPQFPEASALEMRIAKGKNRSGRNVASEEQDILEIVIPSANMPRDGRVLDYEVEFADGKGARDVRYVFASSFYRSRSGGKPDSPTVCRIGLKQLKVSGEVSVSVVPRDSLGTRGRPLKAKTELKMI